MRKQYYITLLVFSAALAVAQQLPQYTQYMLNDLAINPAVAGKYEYTDVRSNNRYQWVGVTDAPRTYMLTMHTPFKKRNMGLGAHVFTDIVGPTRRVGINFSYAYHLKITESLKLAMGLSAGILQLGIDGQKLILRDPNDENLLTKYQTVVVPDFGAGLHLYNDKFYLGLSLPQMYQSKLNVFVDNSKSKLAMHYILNGGYKFSVNEDFKIEPSFLAKYATPAPIKVDAGARFIYKEQVWLGATYRHNDAITALVGFLYKNYLMIGYSYDYTTTRIKNYTTGTHEVMLGIRFSRKQAKTWEIQDK